MRPLILIAAFSLLSLSAHARLGETPAEIAKRYGTPVGTLHTSETNTSWYLYKHAGYRFNVYFWSGRSVQEDVSSETDIDSGTVKNLFKTISGKEPTTVKIDNIKGVSTQTRYTADTAIGTYSSFPRLGVYTLTVFSRDYLQHIRKVDGAEKKD